MNLKIIIAAHKPCWIPDDPVYLPLHVGSEGKEGINFVCDSSGENISSKNPWYCELTGLFWAWKNIDADYIGLVHYRRYFSIRPCRWGTSIEVRRKAVISAEALYKLAEKYPLILPAHRNYFIETRKSQYLKAHGSEGLILAENSLKLLCPQYLPAFHKVMERSWGHIYNMFIMRRDLFDLYCSWLFPVLTDIENAMLEQNGRMEPRIIGFIAERLLDVWIEYNRLNYKEINYVFMERMNWPLKIFNFLKRKYLPAAGKLSK